MPVIYFILGAAALMLSGALVGLLPLLLDLNSTYGTFMGDGRKLPPSYPVQLAAGSRFYLGDTRCLFQLTLP